MDTLPLTPSHPRIIALLAVRGINRNGTGTAILCNSKDGQIYDPLQALSAWALSFIDKNSFVDWERSTRWWSKIGLWCLRENSIDLAWAQCRQPLLPSGRFLDLFVSESSQACQVLMDKQWRSWLRCLICKHHKIHLDLAETAESGSQSLLF